eukprot:s4142_g2.t2
MCCTEAIDNGFIDPNAEVLPSLIAIYDQCETSQTDNDEPCFPFMVAVALAIQAGVVGAVAIPFVGRSVCTALVSVRISAIVIQAEWRESCGEYDCPHSQALEPIWKAAEKDWKAANHDAKLMWQQKECYTTDWKKGKDFETCQAEGIESFPTIKYYYGKKDQLGEEILEHSDKDRLLDFVESRADPQAWDQKTAAFGLSAEQEDAGLSASWGDGQYLQPVSRYGGGRLVDYFSQDCVHCQHLKPVWKNAQRMWNEEHPGADNVQWEEKECFGKRWEPGKDYGECQAQGIHSFPTVRFHPYNSEEFEDFTAQRTAKNLLNFVDERAAPEAASLGPEPSPAPQAPAEGAEAPVETPPVAKAKVGKAQAAEVPEKVQKEPKTAPAEPKEQVKVLKAKQADLKAPEQALAPCLAALVSPGQFRPRSMQPMKEFL